jgi:hypothetical protein
MSGLTRRRVLGQAAFAAVAVGTGAGAVGLATRGKSERLALAAPALRGLAPAPSFGALSSPALVTTLTGDVLAGGRRVGRLSVAPAGDGSLRALTLELGGGTLMAVGPLTGATATVAGGTGDYARAGGTMSIRSSLGTDGAPRLDLDVELELQEA